MSLGCESELSQWRGRKQWVTLFGTRSYVLSIHSIRCLELFVLPVFTDMDAYSPLNVPPCAVGPSGARTYLPSCFPCALRFSTEEDLVEHQATAHHYVSAFMLCPKAQWYICETCNELVPGSLTGHTESTEHVMRLPREYHNIAFFRSHRQDLEWHKVRLYTSPGVASMTYNVWSCVDWELAKAYYDDMQRCHRLSNPTLYPPEEAERKLEHDEKVDMREPPPYVPPADLALALASPAVAERLAPERMGNLSPSLSPTYSPASSDDDAVGVPNAVPPLYAPEDPLHNHEDGPIYPADSDDDAPEPPSY